METLIVLGIIGAVLWKFVTSYAMAKEVKRCPHCIGENYSRDVLDPSPYFVGFERTSVLNHDRNCPNFRLR
jgi:hypothetical protein